MMKLGGGGVLCSDGGIYILDHSKLHRAGLHGIAVKKNTLLKANTFGASSLHAEEGAMI